MRIRGAFYRNFAAVILDDLLHHRQPEPSPILLAVAHEGMKELVMNRFGDARSVVGDGDGDPRARAADRDSDFSFLAGCGLTGVQQKVVQGALQFARIKPGGVLAVAENLNQSALMAWVQTNRLHGSLHGL